MRLAAKLFLVFFLAMAVMTAAAVTYGIRQAQARFQTEQRELVLQSAEKIETRLLSAWKEEGRNGLFQVLDDIGHTSTVFTIRWVWFQRTEPMPAHPAIRTLEEGEAPPEPLVSIPRRDERGILCLRTYYPIGLDDTHRGGLEFSRSMQSLEHDRNERILVAVIGLGALGLVSLLLVVLAGLRWIVHPMRKLVAKTERIGRGEFEDKVDVTGHDELARLAFALNTMSDRIAEQQRTIVTETTARLKTVDQLRHADRLKTVGRLAAGLAHELGTPLNVISGHAGMIVSGRLDAEGLARSGHAVQRETEKMTVIIRQLLDFARPHPGVRTLVNLRTLALEVTSLLEPIAETSGVRFEVDEGPSLSIQADRNQLQQVLTNLTMNAIQSMPEGGLVSIRFDEGTCVPPERPDECARRFATIAITDRGPGIPDEDREHLFEPFFTTKPVGRGTGLGLAISHGIVQEHGGWISVATALGEGSTFQVHLPAEETP